jgi:hypothetical protein
MINVGSIHVLKELSKKIYPDTANLMTMGVSNAVYRKVRVPVDRELARHQIIRLHVIEKEEI